MKKSMTMWCDDRELLYKYNKKLEAYVCTTDKDHYQSYFHLFTPDRWNRIYFSFPILVLKGTVMKNGGKVLGIVSGDMWLEATDPYGLGYKLSAVRSKIYGFGKYREGDPFANGPLGDAILDLEAQSNEVEASSMMGYA